MCAEMYLSTTPETQTSLNYPNVIGKRSRPKFAPPDWHTHTSTHMRRAQLARAKVVEIVAKMQKQEKTTFGV